MPNALSVLRIIVIPFFAWFFMHDQLAIAVALLVLSAAEIRRRWFTILMVAATLLICYSRIYLAKHFPVDLLLGAAVGALTGWAMLCLYRRIKWKC